MIWLQMYVAWESEIRGRVALGRCHISKALWAVAAYADRLLSCQVAGVLVFRASVLVLSFELTQWNGRGVGCCSAWAWMPQRTHPGFIGY